MILQVFFFFFFFFRFKFLLLTPPAPTLDNEDDNKIFLITTYHPNDNQFNQIIRNNWDVLGRNHTTQHLYKHTLVSGFRRPKNLRDILCKAAVTRKADDQKVDPFYVTPPVTITPVTAAKGAKAPIRQTSMLDFVRPNTPPIDARTLASDTSLTQGTTPRQGTHPKERGFQFCNQTRDCRYCPLLNKTGTITSTTTGIKHHCMVKVSCRSSNLVYAITCTRCGLQYVGQTLLRLKDRFVGHLGDINNGNMDKPISAHFAHDGHNGLKDMSISILEFIKKPPRSPQSITIRSRVERNWTHQLRTLAPQGLNQENPKEYHSHRKT